MRLPCSIVRTPAASDNNLNAGTIGKRGSIPRRRIDYTFLISPFTVNASTKNSNSRLNVNSHMKLRLQQTKRLTVTSRSFDLHRPRTLIGITQHQPEPRGVLP